MVDLHPELRAVGGAGLRVGAQRVEPAIAIDHHVARPFEIAPVDLHVAGDDHGRSSRRPSSIEPDVALGGAVHRIGQPLGERRLADAVLEDDAVGQGKRAGNVERIGRGHGSDFAKLARPSRACCSANGQVSSDRW
jgi:hypothetical protein